MALPLPLRMCVLLWQVFDGGLLLGIEASLMQVCNAVVFVLMIFAIYYHFCPCLQYVSRGKNGESEHLMLQNHIF